MKKSSKNTTKTNKTSQFLKISVVAASICSSVAFATNTNINSQITNPTAISHATSTAPVIVPSPPNLNAKGYVLMDATTGTIIAEKNPNKKLPPASLTKLMTIYLISNAIKNGQISPNDKVHISKKAWQMGGSRMFVKVGSNVTVQELLQGIIVASGNDACVAMAQYISGNEKSFAQLMNQTAQYLGMKNTHYVDSTGLPRPGHVSTPYDLSLLTRAIINHFPQDYAWFKQKWLTYNNIKQPNRNRLLWRDPSVDGLKTGHTKAAGFCLISSALRNNMRLISVVMGTPTDAARAQESEALLNYGFRFYQTQQMYGANEVVSTPRVWLGKNKHVTMGVTQAVAVTLPRNAQQKLTKTITYNSKYLAAPIIKGKTYGTVTLSNHGKILTQVPLVAFENDPQSGFWGKLTDKTILWTKHFIKG